jgi:hypothetical protein
MQGNLAGAEAFTINVMQLNADNLNGKTKK